MCRPCDRSRRFDFLLLVCLSEFANHFENNENIKLPYLGNELKNETEIWYSEVIYNADFGYATEIRISFQT